MKYRHEIIMGLLLCILTIIPYWQVRNFGFVNYDDDVHITDNPEVRVGLTPKSIAWSFSFSGYASTWLPLTWLSHMLDVQLFGLNAGRHHLVNIALHMANTLLLFLLLCSMTGAVWKSGFVAALFALHPMHVESVAWVSERKDVLSTLFWFAATFAYIWYTRRRRVRRYLLFMLFFALGLLAKPMLVTLPFTLLLLDFWPLRRLDIRGGLAAMRPLLLEKVPLFLLSGASSVVTLFVQRPAGSETSFEILSWGVRIANAIVATGTYLWKMLVPVNITFFYPHPLQIPPWGDIALSLLCMGIITVLSLRMAQRRPFLIVGWLWYLGTLVPVIGLVQVGAQAMADRYTYIPYVGIFIMIAWGIPELLPRLPFRQTVFTIGAATVLMAMMVRTYGQIGYWRDSITLFTHAIECTQNNFVAHHNLGVYFGQHGEINNAIIQLKEALRINPHSAEAHNNLGTLLLWQGKTDEALLQFYEAQRLKPGFSKPHVNIGLVLASQGKLDEAVAQYQEALRIEPADPQALNNLAKALEAQGKTEEAIRLNPGSFEAHNNLAKLLLKQGKTEEAISHFNEALRIEPNNHGTHTLLGLTLAQQGRIDEAIVHFNEAVRIDPKDGDAYDHLGMALLEQGKCDEALHYLYEALRLDPKHVEVQNNVGLVLAKLGRINEAIVHFKAALRLRPDFKAARQNLDLALKGKHPQR